MKKYGVICSIDVNDFDQDVIDLAASFAKQFAVDLDILHVTLFPDPSNAAWPAYYGSPDAVIQDNRRLRKVTTNVQGVVIHSHHLSGIPTEKILEFVSRNEPRLLVIGTHGRRGLKRIFGSVASKLLRHVECPVMVLRQKQSSEPLAETEPRQQTG